MGVWGFFYESYQVHFSVCMQSFRHGVVVMFTNAAMVTYNPVPEGLLDSWRWLHGWGVCGHGVASVICLFFYCHLGGMGGRLLACWSDQACVSGQLPVRSVDPLLNPVEYSLSCMWEVFCQEIGIAILYYSCHNGFIPNAEWDSYGSRDKLTKMKIVLSASIDSRFFSVVCRIVLFVLWCCWLGGVKGIRPVKCSAATIPNITWSNSWKVQQLNENQTVCCVLYLYSCMYFVHFVGHSR